MDKTLQFAKKKIDIASVALFFLSMLLVAVVYTYLIIKLFGNSEFTSMSSTNAPDILIFGAASTIAFVVWSFFQNGHVKTLLLFGTIFQSLIMIGAIALNNYISIYPVLSAPFQEWYWLGWVAGIIVQPIIALGVVLLVKNKTI